MLDAFTVTAALLGLGILAVLAFLFPPVRAFLAFLIQGTRTVLRALLNFPFHLNFAFVWLALAMAIYVNAPSIWGEDAQNQRDILTIYFVLVMFSLVFQPRRNPLVGTSFAEFAIVFTVWASLTAAILALFQPFVPAQQYLTSASIGLLLVQAFVVAIAEELFYRFLLPSFVPGPAIVGQALGALVFGFTHYTAYGGAIGPLVFAVLAGFLFGVLTVYSRRGIIAAMGAHFAWNAAQLGFVFTPGGA